MQSGSHPSEKQPMASCLAMTPSAHNETSVQSQPPLTGGPRNEGSRQRSWRGWDSHDAVKLTAVQAVARSAWGVVSNKAQEQKILMSEATGIALPMDAPAENCFCILHGGPCFCAIKKIIHLYIACLESSVKNDYTEAIIQKG